MLCSKGAKQPKRQTESTDQKLEVIKQKSRENREAHSLRDAWKKAGG